MQKQRLGLAILLLSLIATGCTSAVQTAPPNTAGATTNPYEYRIGPEDVLTVSVWKNPELSGTVAVRPDGMITLPLLNDVKASGATPEELRDSLTEKFQAYVNNAEVSVIVKEVHSQKVSVLGQVTTPARYKFNAGLTVLDAIAMAGGLTPFAARKRIAVIRKGPNGELRLPFNYNEAADSLGRIGNFEVYPGDIIMVPKSGF